MKYLVFVLIIMICASCAHEDSRNVAYENGLWLDGSSFTERTMYSQNGIFSDRRPSRIDTAVNLKGSYIIPPFGEAHSHHYDNPAILEAVNELSLRDGVFYGMSMNNWIDAKEEVQSFFKLNNSVDVAYADLGLTASYGHPIMVYEHLARQSYTFERRPEFFADRRAEGRAYLLFDSVDEVELKWPEVLKSGPDLLKIYLLNTEEREQLINDSGRTAALGLDPNVAEAIVQRAKREGLRVAAHVETAYDFRLAVDIGVDIIAHLPGYSFRNNPNADPEIYRISYEDAVRGAEAGMVVIPTPLTTQFEFIREEEREKIRDFFAGQLHTLSRAGIMLAMGSDAYMQTPLREVLYIYNLGIFSNQQLLQMWTENTAKTIFPERNLGRLEPGYEASFLALECNPLEDFSCIKNIQIRLKSGQVLDGSY